MTARRQNWLKDACSPQGAEHSVEQVSCRLDPAEPCGSTPDEDDILYDFARLMILVGPTVVLSLNEVCFTKKMLLAAFPNLSASLTDEILQIIFLVCIFINISLFYLLYTWGCIFYKKWRDPDKKNSYQNCPDAKCIFEVPKQTRSGKAYGYREAVWFTK